MISVIIPVVRLESAERCIASVRKYLPPETEIISEVDTDRIGCPMMVEKLTARTTNDWVMFLGDDTEIESEEFWKSLEPMLATPGVIGLNTQPGEFKLHWAAHKSVVDGPFFATEYTHSFCDDELKDIATERGVWFECEGAKLKHNHPGNGGVVDKFYQSAYGDSVFLRDRATYIRRKRERYVDKIAIGFPLVDPMVPVQFFTSFACMDKPSEYVLLVPKLPHGPWNMSIADARNSLVEQAQMEGARYLLMLDTDQTYPHDTLTKLLSHKVDVCGVRVHRRWMPFDPIFLRGELGKYHNVSDDEAYSGELIEIDATGTGCLLFDMQIGDKIDGKWFEFAEIEGKPVGEDINFCSKARQAGVRIFVDTSIEVGHLITMEVNRSMHMLCKAMTPKT